MSTTLEELKKVLPDDDRLVANGNIINNKVIELALNYDEDLLQLLYSNDILKESFFKEIGDVVIFESEKFHNYLNKKEFLKDSYTKYKNKIGLSNNESFLTSDINDVVISWPYKDCIFEGIQTEEDSKYDERFLNKVLAKEEVDRLLEPKALTNFQRILKDSSKEAETISHRDNLLIKGNNLLMLNTIKKAYRNKIKLIYIDPPYNTGKDNFCYNDKFSHSTWLTFIKNRLESAKELLSDEGVIFISIDINEHSYLKVLCDEIFGRDNFVGEIIWETATDNNPTQISIEHEYVICYAKDFEKQDNWEIKSEKAKVIEEKYEELREEYGDDNDKVEKLLRNWINSVKKTNEYDLSGVSHYNYVDDKGVFYPGNPANTRPGGYDYDIIHPETEKICAKPSNGYRWPKETFKEADKKGDVLWGEDETIIPKIKKRIDTATELLKGYFYEDNRKSTNELAKLMGEKVFDNPKSINLLKKIIKFTTDDDDIILDFFAGSGSTAQAVIEVNEEEQTNRQFILCEQLDYIEDITAPRIQKCLGNGKENFVYCELASLNENLVDEIKSANSENDLKKFVKKYEDYHHWNFRVDLTELKQLFDSENDLNLQEMKNLLIESLDKNMLYIPLSEMEDSEYSLSNIDKKLTREILLDEGL